MSLCLSCLFKSGSCALFSIAYVICSPAALLINHQFAFWLYLLKHLDIATYFSSLVRLSIFSSFAWKGRSLSLSFFSIRSYTKTFGFPPSLYYTLLHLCSLSLSLSLNANYSLVTFFQRFVFAISIVRAAIIGKSISRECFFLVSTNKMLAFSERTNKKRKNNEISGLSEQAYTLFISPRGILYIRVYSPRDCSWFARAQIAGSVFDKCVFVVVGLIFVLGPGVESGIRYFSCRLQNYILFVCLSTYNVTRLWHHLVPCMFIGF